MAGGGHHALVGSLQIQIVELQKVQIGSKLPETEEGDGQVAIEERGCDRLD